MDMLRKIAVFSSYLVIVYLLELKTLKLNTNKNFVILSIKILFPKRLKHYKDNNPYKLQSNLIRGFTLLELIVTVTVLAIIIAIAAPVILKQLANMEAKRIRYSLENTLAVAKAESLIRRQDILVCLSDGNGQCNKNSNKTLLLFFDKDDNKHFDVGNDILIEEQTLKPKYGTLHLRAGTRHYVKFYGDSGKPRGHFGHIKYCTRSTYSNAMYQVSFNQSGIVKYKPNNIHPTECDK